MLAANVTTYIDVIDLATSCNIAEHMSGVYLQFCSSRSTKDKLTVLGGLKTGAIPD